MLFDAERDTYECLLLLDALEAVSESINSSRSRGFSDPESESTHKHNREMLKRAGVGGG